MKLIDAEKLCMYLADLQLSNAPDERLLRITQVGLDYGIVTLKPFDGKFYFENFAERQE